MSTLAAIESGGSAIVVGNGSGPSGGAGPVERIALARPALPCPGCVHAPVCAIRPLLDVDALALRSPASPHEAIRIRLTVEVECSHFLAGEVAPGPAAPVDRMAASRKRGAGGLVRARAVKAERHKEAGGGSGQAAEPGGPHTQPRDARTDCCRDARELRTPAGCWIGDC